MNSHTLHRFTSRRPSLVALFALPIIFTLSPVGQTSARAAVLFTAPPAQLTQNATTAVFYVMGVLDGFKKAAEWRALPPELRGSGLRRVAGMQRAVSLVFQMTEPAIFAYFWGVADGLDSEADRDGEQTP